MIVTLKAGDRLECALKESGADDLTVITSTGSELKLAKSEVRKVETEDGIRDGVLMCAAGEGADYTTTPTSMDFGLCSRCSHPLRV